MHRPSYFHILLITPLQMSSSLHRPISPPALKSTALLAALLLLFPFPPAAAQSPPASRATAGDNQYNTSISPALAILVVALVTTFFLLGFFFISLRRCAGDRSAVAPAALAGISAGRSPRRGLDSALLNEFPTMVYSSVKFQKLGKEALECAVCLCEFGDDDVLRLLPRCSHVYHRDCIDVWFSTHVTCPVCRFNLAAGDAGQPQPQPPEAAAAAVVSEDLGPEMADFVRIGSERREARGGSVKGVSTGSRSEGGERFRLRLPEEVKREIFAVGGLRRTASFAIFSGGGEGSSRRGYREGVGRAWRSLRIGRSGRWPVLGRSFSLRSPAAVAPAAEGSVSGGGEGGGVVGAFKVPDGGEKGDSDGGIPVAGFHLV